MSRRSKSKRQADMIIADSDHWDYGPLGAATRHLAWLLCFPSYVYMLLRHHTTYSTTAILGGSNTNFGNENDLMRFGGLFEDGETIVETGYAKGSPTTQRSASHAEVLSAADAEVLGYLRERGHKTAQDADWPRNRYM